MTEPARATDKLAFLLALVPYLLDNDGVSVTEAARHFDVPGDRVREAVRLIAVSGIPGESRAYDPNDLFDIDWVAFEADETIWLTHQVAIDESPRFSAREAAALIAGLQYLSAIPENADRATIATLTAKLTRGASTRPTSLAVAEEAEPPSLPVIRSALGTGILRFDYLNGRGEREARLVEPLRVESVDASWYLRGWDRGRGALRTFRLDRMRAVEAVQTDAPLLRPAGLELPERIFTPSALDTTVELDVAESVLPLIADYLTDAPQPKPTPLHEGWMHTRIRIAHLNGLARLVAAHGGLVRVREPQEARAAVRAWAEAGAAQYSPGTGGHEHPVSGRPG